MMFKLLLKVNSNASSLPNTRAQKFSKLTRQQKMTDKKMHGFERESESELTVVLNFYFEALQTSFLVENMQTEVDGRICL